MCRAGAEAVRSIAEDDAVLPTRAKLRSSPFWGRAIAYDGAERGGGRYSTRPV